MFASFECGHFVSHDFHLFFLVVSGNGKAPCLTTRHQCIASITLWTSAHGRMTTSFADCIRATLANAWINARIIQTCTIVGTFDITLAFAASTMCQWVTGIARQTGAHWTLFASIIVTWNALCICAAWIWSAQISCKSNKYKMIISFREHTIFLNSLAWCEWTTTNEWIASHITWTTADRCQSTEITVGINTTSAITWILADAIITCWTSGWTIAITITFGTAFSVWTSQIILRI